MRALSRMLLSLTAAASLTGCSLPYYWQAIGGQVELLSKRVPIDAALADETLDPDVKRVLREVPDILDFAVSRLGLPDNDSYRTYVNLDRPYVVWNVIAAPEFSVEPVQWCFPFAGCVAYRGYFDRSDAARFRGKLNAQELDTYLGGATAYSTLGYFDDPVLSTMLGGGSEILAALLFHELAHQRLYVKGDSEFNEAYATAIEEYGIELWLTENADRAALEAYRARRSRRERLAELVRRQQTRLESIYARAADESVKRRDKREAFARMRAEYAELKRRWGGSSEYDAWFEGDLNNASLAAVATYRRWLPALRVRLAEVGVAAFHAELERAAELPQQERDALLESWLPASSAVARLP